MRQVSLQILDATTVGVKRRRPEKHLTSAGVGAILFRPENLRRTHACRAYHSKTIEGETA